MSGAGRDKELLATLLHRMAHTCRFCECTGDTCKTITGERCELVGEMQSRCNGVACDIRYWAGKNAAKRASKRLFNKRRKAAPRGREA